ncbi:MAG: WYL domain-containing protein [Bacteroidales bacterium]|nr:WYL domain-containing protein [Bacteroidales bacterium]
MNTPRILREYIWLISNIYQAKEITLAELAKRWKESDISYGSELTRSSFKRYKSAIADAFGIDIECNVNNGYTYHIADMGSLENDTVQNWIISTLSINSLISNDMTIRERIVLEEIPYGGRNLETIIGAMKTLNTLAIVYRRYECNEAKTHNIDPYAIKLFGRRWYVVAHSEEHDIAVYSLDRIESIEVTQHTFEMPDNFNARKLFDECFGVIIGDGTPAEKIVLKIYGKERQYVKSLPLHSSQTLVEEKKDYTVYSYHLRPTYDFKQAILSNITDIEVIEPVTLRHDIKEMLTRSLKRYRG